MLITSIVSSQNSNLNEIKITAPEFKSAFYSSVGDFLTRYVGYPEELKKAKVEGTEVVRFVITSKGNITDFEVLNSI